MSIILQVFLIETAPKSHSIHEELMGWCDIDAFEIMKEDIY